MNLLSELKSRSLRLLIGQFTKSEAPFNYDFVTFLQLSYCLEDQRGCCLNFHFTLTNNFTRVYLGSVYDRSIKIWPLVSRSS